MRYRDARKTAGAYPSQKPPSALGYPTSNARDAAQPQILWHVLLPLSILYGIRNLTLDIYEPVYYASGFPMSAEPFDGTGVRRTFTHFD